MCGKSQFNSLVWGSLTLAPINKLGECGALWGERERVVCIAQAVNILFIAFPPKVFTIVNVYTGNEIII